MSDWWAKKLGQTVPQGPPKYGITLPPQQPVYQQQPVPQAPQTAPVYQQGPLRVGEQPQKMLDPEADRNAEVTFGVAMRNWRGGEAHRTSGDCPGCGSKIGYTTNPQTGARPHCFECGYRGDYYMQGDPSSWGALA